MTTPWRFYVYELIDPRDDSVFYVGKGQNRRMYAHEDEARKGVCSEKCLRIREIWDAGLQIERQIVANFKAEAHAYEYEAERINSYGLDALTNIMPGGGGVRARVRERGYVGRAVKWNGLIAAKMIARSERVAEWMAVYLKALSIGADIRIEGPKFDVSVVKVALVKLFPNIWEMVKADDAAIEVLKPVMARHGVDFVYGSA